MLSPEETKSILVLVALMFFVAIIYNMIDHRFFEPKRRKKIRETYAQPLFKAAKQSGMNLTIVITPHNVRGKRIAINDVVWEEIAPSRILGPWLCEMSRDFINILATLQNANAKRNHNQEYFDTYQELINLIEEAETNPPLKAVA